jgi:hypothetical protein
MTSFQDNSGSSATISLTKGTLYWVAIGVLGGATDPPMLSSQLNSTYNLVSFPPAYTLNGGGYNPKGACRALIQSPQGTTLATVFPSTYTAPSSMADKNWSNSSYDTPIYVGIA